MNILAFLLVAAIAFGQPDSVAPVKTIDIYVTPYYLASKSEGVKPTVAVARDYDTLLADGGKENTKRVAAGIQANDGLITPMTMMVLAIRFYDAGLRDDSAFWFYVAKERYFTASRVLDFSTKELSEVNSAVESFISLAGPEINGYAFCDISSEQAIKAKAVEWVASHPYQAIFSPSLVALPGDRKSNLDLGIVEMRKRAQGETNALHNPTILKTLADGRKETGADAKYCWK